MELEQRDQQSIFSINLGLMANVFLAALKTAIGVLGHSPALLAEGINSTSDVAYYLVASVFIRLARKPADLAHPYGHRQLESIAALIVGSFVITTAVAVFWGSISEVFDLWRGTSVFEGASGYALWVALLTVLLKLGLTSYTRAAGRQTGNAVVLAMASDHRNDVLSASAAGLGIFLGQRGYPWVDPLAGALVALLILRTGIGILHEASVELMDAVPSRELEAQVKRLLEGVPGVMQVEEVHAHRFGPYLVLNLTIGIDGSLSVKVGDEIASHVERVLSKNIALLRRVHIHYHPAVPPRVYTGS
jgi:cation diffusion facilitator family transporter